MAEQFVKSATSKVKLMEAGHLKIEYVSIENLKPNEYNPKPMRKSY